MGSGFALFLKLCDQFLFVLIMQELFAEPDNREFFISVGRDLISRLLLNAEKVSFIRIRPSEIL